MCVGGTGKYGVGGPENMLFAGASNQFSERGKFYGMRL